MRLHERLPDTVKAGGRKYKVDLDFRNVLRMIDTLGRDDLFPRAREYVALKCVMKRPPKDTGPMMNALKALLFPPAKKQSDKKLTDFAQDADLIRAAFLQAYGINLWRDRLHWLEFTGLLSALPEGSRYADILSIRARPLPKPNAHNAEEREALMRAKAEFAVQITDKERENMYQSSLHQIATAMLGMARKGGGADA